MAPEEMSDAVETTDTTGREVETPRRGDPRTLTSRERRRRLILLTLMSLLLLLLTYLAYYFSMNRRLPSLGLAPAKSTFIQPPRYLYSISGKTASSALVRPVGVGVADDGRVYVVDFGHKRVSVFSNPGVYLFSFDTTADGKLVTPIHLAVKGDEVWVSERSRQAIYVFDLQGKYLRKFVPKNETLKWTPLAFSFDASGGLRATDVGNSKLHRLQYFSPDGSRTVTIGKTAQAKALQDQPGTFMFPNGVALASNGDVYVSDGDNRRVQVFNSNGEFVRFIDTSGVPRGIAIDEKQKVYVADALAHVITVFDLKGAVLTQFGERGFGPGQFNYPNDIAIDKRGRIYISDRENGQVQVWGWPVAQLPLIPVPKGPLSWLAALACLVPLILLPLLLLARRKIRIVVTPEFVTSLERAEEIRAVSERPRLRLVAPEEDRALYAGRIVDGVSLEQLLTFEEHSDSDARALVDRLKIDYRPALLLSMAWRAKALATNEVDLRHLSMLAEVRVVDLEEFRELYLGGEHGKRDSSKR